MNEMGGVVLRDVYQRTFVASKERSTYMNSRLCSHDPPPLMRQALDKKIGRRRPSWSTHGESGGVQKMLAKFEAEKELASTLRPSRRTRGASETTRRPLRTKNAFAPLVA